MKGALAMTDMKRIGEHWIAAEPKPTESHWAHIRDPGEHLAEILDGMAAMVRLYHGEATDADLERLDYSADSVSRYDNADAGWEAFESWALEIRRATWSEVFNTPTDITARVVAVLGTGGPHVEVDILCTSDGRPECIELRRYWTQQDRARSTDSGTLDTVADFLNTFLGGDA